MVTQGEAIFVGRREFNFCNQITGANPTTFKFAATTPAL
jgi:hypothetical protein